ncbi:MAG: exodeoxyribonuclease VII large subunit, partial [Coraliomargarita sp.]
MLDDLLKPDQEHILKVSELTRHIKRQLEGEFAQVWVQGEVSNLRRQSSGHVYFSLKDSGSQLPCVLFARDAARQSFQLQEGMEVVLFGDISVYEPHGRYQLIAKITIESGIGRLQAEFEKLKRKLHTEGLFDKERKQPLPALPARIAVVTSPTGAAIKDFLRILHRRDYRGEVVIFPARVQGTEASGEVTQMLQHAAASEPGFDLIVITRGGGSIEDLWAFNEEALARAVAACHVPVISAVGHEIDTVLTDYASDRRAETPSGAAELISSLYLESWERFETAGENLRYWIDQAISDAKVQLRDLQARMQILAPGRQLENLSLRLDDYENRINQALKDRLAQNQQRLAALQQGLSEHHPRTRLSLAKLSTSELKHRLEREVEIQLNHQKEQLEYFDKRLQNSSLNATMQR